MNHASVWKRRPLSSLGPEEYSRDVKLTWAGPISTKLYGDGLQNLSHKTHGSLQRIRSSMTKIDPCLEYGIEHWHPERRPKSAHPYMTFGPDKSTVSWQDASVMFTNAKAMQSPASTSSIHDDNASVASTIARPLNFCYLCSTLEEHERNHLHSSHPYKPSNKPQKPRICYIAPKPKVKRKVPEPVLSKDALYRVVVWTGLVPGAGTDAAVHISIKGSHDYLPRTKLTRGQGSVKFAFVEGAKDTFYIKGPKLGNLEYLTVEIEHEHLEKHHGWYLEKIEVTEVRTDQKWLFVCENWLSLYHGDYRIKRDLEAIQKERLVKEYEVTVYTSKKRLAGTDANVYITLHGTDGVSPKIHLASQTKETFEKGSVDHFNIKIRDIGEIKRLRIEHDGSGFAPGWHLEKVIIQDRSDTSIIYYFLYGGWLSKDAGAGHLWREIKAKRKLAKEVTKGKPVKYQVTVKTGDVKYAGTDANVFIQFVGPRGTTKKLIMDDARDNFERGQTEIFDLEALNVGPLTRIVIGHDNVGPGAGWYLEDVHVRKYLSREEIIERLKRMKKFHKESGQHKRKRLAEKLNKKDDQDEYKGKDKQRHRDSSSESESDEEYNKGQRGSKREQEIASDMFDRDGKVVRVPEYEEYYFVCKNWLAKDEGDGLTVRELEVNKKETYFKDKN